jgi:hypothetical protein
LSVASLVRYASIVAAAALLLTFPGCATPGIGSGSRPRPTPTSRVEHVAWVTEQDHAVTVTTGQRLLLELHATTGMTNWKGLRSSDTSVLKPITVDVMIPKGVTVAAFVAISPGQVMVTAVAAPACSPAQACPVYVLLYSLQVTVAPAERRSNRTP